MAGEQQGESRQLSKLANLLKAKIKDIAEVPDLFGQDVMDVKLK